ncbi:hypothetical protein [Pseudovibrio sp. Ad37]|uniref:hypothetical protein n=1 Tax=Pseudovibrio sp. Ad37 TaxID=989422 RepID=UPI0007AE8375|nr:hypothetical protein [Pseudovibrio sp. Ad37]KZL22678.1 hypothetical protein PsAD37_03326 [Pseudovibrio sp. Ad37]
MSTPEQRLEIYRKSFERFAGNQGDLARLMDLGGALTNSKRGNISEKLKGVKGKGISKAEALAIQLLTVFSTSLAENGHSVSDIEFDEDGFLTKETEQLLKGLGRSAS